MAIASESTRQELPIILIRGFGGLDAADERKQTYYGFNDGTVYPQRQGENYIYEGLILRMMKSKWRYQDATNIINYYDKNQPRRDIVKELAKLPKEFFFGEKIVVDPALALALKDNPEPMRTLWVFRYYDLDDRTFPQYGVALKRLIELVRTLVAQKTGGDRPKVNIIAHSMGGLIVREALQVAYKPGEAAEAVNKVVTLGTPHKGIAFQRMKSLKWLPFLEAGSEIERFNPERQADTKNPAGYKNLAKAFPLDRLLCVVGTNYRAFSVAPATILNKLFSIDGEFGMNYNRSDGLVKIDSASVPGRATRLRVQVPWRRGLADHLARGIRDRHPLLPWRHPRAPARDRCPDQEGWRLHRQERVLHRSVAEAARRGLRPLEPEQERRELLRAVQQRQAG